MRLNFMLSNISLLIILIFAALSAGCGSSKKIERPAPQKTANQPKAPVIDYDESFDPLSLKDPPFEIPRRSASTSGYSQTFSAQADTTAQDTSLVTVPGFQVQLLQSEDGQEARESMRVAILELDTDVEVVYEAPYYKVRAGKFLSRYDAERLQSLADEKGYPNSWVIRTPIEVRAYELSNRR